MALPYLSRGVTMSAVISLDAARATPTWKADETLFRLLLKLREVTEKEVLLQSRTEADDLIDFAARGAVEKFFDEEIALRQLLRYPPFVDFILLTWTGDTEVIARAEEIIKKTINSPLARFYNNPNSTPNKIIRHCLLRVASDNDDLYDDLIKKIKRLPPFVKIEINPDRIV